jgi:glutaminyl-tRNA synthetase
MSTVIFSEKPLSDKPSNFLRDIIDQDLASGRHTGVVTRFPPEPNGYLHIGHAKSICLNFGLARDYQGVCHLRFDDTNPAKESDEFVRSIQEDVKWLGSHTGAPERGSDFDWKDKLFYASSYFEALYGYAEELISSGKAYIDSLTRDEVAEYRGSLTEGGRESPYRSRTPAENLDLFRRMRAGEFAEGEHVLRMKGDMKSPNMKMRDLPLYRIMRAHHHRTGDAWCIYPLYDFAHCISDAIERITHSICTLEFENNREVYDWILDNVSIPRPQPHQYEFARLELTYTVTSKRKLKELVDGGVVSGWDDPRMPTVAGLRRSGCTPEAIRAFCDRIGVSKNNSTVDIELFEWAVRQDLEARCDRLLGVVDPIRLVITNYPAGETETITAPLRPDDDARTRNVPFSRELYIARDDFMLSPPEGFFRLSPGATVRLRYAYNITCTGVAVDADGRVTEVQATYDEATRGQGADGKKVKGTLHWVSAAHAVTAEVRLYDRLFEDEAPGAGGADPLASLNPGSLRVAEGFIEPYASTLGAGARVQLERVGYFYFDPKDSRPGALVLNRTVTLKDTWAKGAVETDPERLREERVRVRAEEKARSGQRGAEAPFTDGQQAIASAFPTLLAAEVRFIAASPLATEYFRAAAATYVGEPRRLATWLQSAAQALDGVEAALALPVADFLAVVNAVDAGTISAAIGKAAFAEQQRSGAKMASVIEALRPARDDGALTDAAKAVLDANAEAVARYRAGNKNLVGFFLGQLMKQAIGKADPAASRRVIESLLAEP